MLFGGFLGIFRIPGKPTGNLLPSLLGGTPQDGHTPGVSLSGSAQSYRPGMHFVELGIGRIHLRTIPAKYTSQLFQLDRQPLDQKSTYTPLAGLYTFVL